MTISSILILFLFLFFFVGIYLTLSYFFSSSMDNPDCSARITGNCGDTMELKIKIKDGRVIQAHHWCDGCSVSTNCIETAARLALGKDIKQLKTINMTHIMEEVGQLPDSHLHCAQLAEITLHAAMDDFLKRQINADLDSHPAGS